MIPGFLAMFADFENQGQNELFMYHSVSSLRIETIQILKISDLVIMLC